VEQGQPIALITLPQQTANGQSVLFEVNASTETQLALVDNRITQSQSAHSKELASLKASIAFSRQSLSQTTAQIAHATERLRIQGERLDNLTRLHSEGAIAKNDLHMQEEQVILLKQ
jgi:hypothetical protein